MDIIRKKINSFNRSISGPLKVAAIIFTFVPAGWIDNLKFDISFIEGYEPIVNRIAILLFIWLVKKILDWFFGSIQLDGTNYKIEVKYGDIFDIENSKKVIPFTECYTTQTGDGPNEIKEKSICGQFLALNNIDKIRETVNNNENIKSNLRSKYQNLSCYESGVLIPYNQYLLMAFSKLNENGLAEMTYKEYVKSLFKLWKEIDKYYGDNDVCIPIIGSGRTRIGDKKYTKQDLVEIIIMTYKLSRHKLKSSNKLIIVCRRNDIDLNKVGQI